MELGILVRSDKKLLKEVNENEMSFYQKIRISNTQANLRISPHIPEFLGIQKVFFTDSFGTCQKSFLILSDVTENWHLPNIVDIKIGFKTWNDFATMEKISSKESKPSETRNALGFTVKGMLVNSFSIGCKRPTVKKYGKSFGVALRPEDLNIILETFFDTKGYNFASECICVILQKIYAIYDAFSKQKTYNFIGSSLLIAYDANAVQEYRNKKIFIDTLGEFIAVKVIDFGNIQLSDGKEDGNFLNGLKNVIDMFEHYTNI